MNLHDIVGRRDRMLGNPQSVESTELKLPGGGHRAVRIFPGSDGLLLKDAQEAIVIQSCPTYPGWQAHMDPGARLDVWLESDNGERQQLFGTSQSGTQLALHWPTPSPRRFDLRLVATSGAVTVTVGPLFNARARLLPLMVGKGVEVGPGRNPAVLPSATRDVRYIEQVSMEEWSRLYAKADLGAAAEHWDRYIVGSAHTLDQFDDGSLQFIFSSHVVEHLVNPLGVLRNWWSKLAPGGVIAGVVPDARFTFDLRQPLSQDEEFREQAAVGSYQPTQAMYEKWCRYTAPYNTPQSLRERGYSIHVNYYSVDSFRRMLGMFDQSSHVEGIFMESVQNGKDFGFLISKPS